MGAEKLSISLDEELVASIRAAAAEEGVTISTWLAGAAEVKVRQMYLREALAAFDAEHGALEPAEADALVAAARRKSVTTGGRAGVA